MNYSQFRSILSRKIGLMILVGFLLAAVSFWGIMLLSPRYQSNLDVLVIQNQESFVDSYTLAKSTEHFSKLLSESVYTETFLNKVIEGDPELSKILPIEREDRMKAWGRMVQTSINVELGMIHLKALANDKGQVERMSKTIASVLAENNNLFISENQNIEVRMINAPLIKNNPGMNILIFTVVASFLIGVLLVFIVSFYKNLIDQGKSKNDRLSEKDVWNRTVTEDDFGNIIDAKTGEIISPKQE
jgi:capsular polysaccharide biosynthesis protein